MRIFPRYDGPPLLEQVCTVENLTSAWRRVRSNIHVARRGHSAGPDAVTVRDFETDWSRQIAQLAAELREGRYRPLPPRHVSIPKASGGERAIAILAVRDRIAQRAVQQVLEPLFDPLFLDCSYGCRPGVGVPEAVARVVRYADQGLIWAADADVARYFDSIDHRMLLGLVRQRVDELPLLHLIAQWLAVGALTASDSQPITQWGGALLDHCKQALQHALAWGADHATTALPAFDLADPYAGAAWEQSPAIGAPSPGLWPPRPHGLDQRLWTAAMLVKPVVAGARSALPYMRRLGGRRLALAGVVATGAIAIGELMMRSRQTPGRGAPQGGSLSPLLANAYLHPFDLALTSQGLRIVRFMDDFVIMCTSQSEAERAMELARRQLAALHLELNTEKSHVVSYADGLEFLGQALAPRQHGPRLGHGLASFTEAEQALRTVAGTVRRRFRK